MPLRPISAYKTDGIPRKIDYLRFVTGLQNLHSVITGAVPSFPLVTKTVPYLSTVAV